MDKNPAEMYTHDGIHSTVPVIDKTCTKLAHEPVSNLDTSVVWHERAKHGLKVAAPCSQDGFVSGDADVAEQQTNVTELAAFKSQERLHVLLKSITCHVHSTDQWLSCKKRSGETLPFSVLSFPSSPPSLPCREGAPQRPARVSGECCKFPQWGPRQSPGRKRILVYF